MDHVLDILVAPDLSSWEWKDEAEFDFAQKAGHFSPYRADEIREVGHGILKAVEAGEPPWDTSWATWTPPGP